MKNKKVVITGGSSGLGFAMAEALLQCGASVLITGRSEEKLTRAVDQLQQSAGTVYALRTDIRNEEDINKAVLWVQEQWGGVDLLVNNAGIGMRTVNASFLSSPMPFYKVTSQDFRNVIDTNLTGYFLVAKAFIPLFLQQGRGKIVNISMNHETMKRKGFVPYGPSRAAAESLSYIMAEDLKDHNIDVNILLPGGATETGMIPEEFIEPLKKAGVLLSASIMAEAIIFLASDESTGITGERIIAKEFTPWKQKYMNHQKH